jgi:membrane protein implicated in regulation of membrane protease activity
MVMSAWLESGLLAWHWVVIGFVLAALEILLPSFFMLWLGVSAIAVGLITLLVPMALAWQLLLWVALSLGCLVAWFKFVAPTMKDKTRSGMARESMLGQVATVLDYQAATCRGQLRFSAPALGEAEWRFICEQPLKPGDRVCVADFSGNDLIVRPQ